MKQKASWTIEALGDEVATPERYAGGGAVAAMSLVGAAATAELVISLSARRRNISREDARKLEALRGVAADLRSSFLDAVDADILSLATLMDAQRECRLARRASDSARLDAAEQSFALAVKSAIDTPLSVAGQAITLLDSINQARQYARQFTMSDLAAAAATAQGAIFSLVLMAEANLTLLDSEDAVSDVQRDADQLWEDAARAAEEIIGNTRAATRRQLMQDER